MNLLAKRGKWWLLAMLITVWGCKEDLGIEVEPGQGRTEGTFVEILLPVQYTLVDSIRTDNSAEILVGQFSDPSQGTITAQSFFEFAFSEGLTQDSLIWVKRTEEISEEETLTYSDSIADIAFESATLRLKVRKALSSSLSISQDFVVHTLADSIFESSIYLNNRTVPTNEEIGRQTEMIADLEPVNSGEDTLVIKLDVTSNFTSGIFDAIVEDGTSLRFEGLRVSSENSNGIWGFDLNHDSTFLELAIKGTVYDTSGVATVKSDTLLTTTLRLIQNRHFVNIERDFTGSPFENLEPGDLIDPDSEVLFSPLAGIHPVLDMTPFLDFLEEQSSFIATLGNLEITLNEEPAFQPHVEGIRIYFGQEEDSKLNVNWPGILTSPTIYSVTLLAEDAYLNRIGPLQKTIFLDSLSTAPVEVGFNGGITSFLQLSYQNVLEELDGTPIEDRVFPLGYINSAKRLLLYPTNTVTPSQSTVQMDGAKLKIFYTKIKE